MIKIIRYKIKEVLDVEIGYVVYCEYETTVGFFRKKKVIKEALVCNDGSFLGGGTYTQFKYKSSADDFISRIKRINNIT